MRWMILLETIPALEALTGTMASIRSDTQQVISQLNLSAGAPRRDRIWRAYVGDRNSKRHNPKYSAELQASKEESSAILWSAVGQSITEICCYRWLLWERLLRPVTTAYTICYLLKMIPFLLVIWFQWVRQTCLIVLQQDVIPSFHPMLLSHKCNTCIYLYNFLSELLVDDVFPKTITVGPNLHYCPSDRLRAVTSPLCSK